MTRSRGKQDVSAAAASTGKKSILVLFLAGMCGIQIMGRESDVLASYLVPSFLSSDAQNSSSLLFSLLSSSNNRSKSLDRHDMVCSNNNNNASAALNSKKKNNREWELLCGGGLVTQADTILKSSSSSNNVLHIVQIGAHIGFETNDPLANGLTSYLHLLTPPEKSRVTWTFVEPSPPNYKRLVTNVAHHSSSLGCHMETIQAGVVADTPANTNTNANTNSTTTATATTTQQSHHMTFYSLHESIDPQTGYDSKSGKQLPKWITQVSGFTKAPILFNKRVFQRQGLRVQDYIVETNVTTYPYSSLLQQVCQNEKEENSSALFLLLIDTEGFDCDIILGISEESAYLPLFMVFESHQCGSPKLTKTIAYLQKLGYHVQNAKGTQNTIAIRQQ